MGANRRRSASGSSLHLFTWSVSPKIDIETHETRVSKINVKKPQLQTQNGEKRKPTRFSSSSSLSSVYSFVVLSFNLIRSSLIILTLHFAVLHSLTSLHFTHTHTRARTHTLSPFAVSSLAPFSLSSIFTFDGYDGYDDDITRLVLLLVLLVASSRKETMNVGHFVAIRPFRYRSRVLNDDFVANVCAFSRMFGGLIL